MTRKPASQPTPESSSHTWTVDSIEEGVVRVEEDGSRMLSVAANLLPPGIREGQVLRVTRSLAPADQSAVLSVAVDPAATAAALDASAKKTAHTAAESTKGDRGGDVTL